MKLLKMGRSLSTHFSELLGVIIAFLISGAILLSSSYLWAGGGPNVSGAKLYIQQNNLDQALTVLLKEIQEVKPNNEDAWYLLGYVYARQQKYDKMMEAFNKALELKPKFMDKGIKINKDTGTQFHSQFGVEMITRIVWGNSFNRGVRYFNDAISSESDSVRTANFEKAVDAFRAAALIKPDSTLSYRNMAAALLNMGKIEECIEPLKQAIARNPADFETKIMLATAYMNSQRDSLALPILEELWADGHRSEEVADYLSQVYVRTGKTEQAKLVYKEAIETNPDNFHFRYNYGTILLEANEYDSAIEQFLGAYEIDPESADINYNLGAAYLNRGVAKRDALPEDSEDRSYIEDFKLAFPYLEKSIKMNPYDEKTWFTFGQIAGKLNKIALAGYAFSKAEPQRSVLDDKVIVGMQSSTLKMILGEPDHINPIESEVFSTVEEWVYKKRPASKGKLAIPDQLNVYVDNGRVEAFMVFK
ncbi:MAG: tetratricopeptide repeat protein [bacterium]